MIYFLESCYIRLIIQYIEVQINQKGNMGRVTVEVRYGSHVIRMTIKVDSRVLNEGESSWSK